MFEEYFPGPLEYWSEFLPELYLTLEYNFPSSFSMFEEYLPGPLEYWSEFLP